MTTNITTSVNSTSKRSRVGKFWRLIALAILLGIGLAGYNGLQIRNDRALAADKARFVQAEREVDDLSRDIVAAVGEPLEKQSRNYCSRPSAKYGEGELSCNVTQNLFYGVENETQATQIYQDASSLNPATWKRVKASTSNNLNSKPIFSPMNLSDYLVDRDEQQIFEVNDSSLGGIDCRRTYTLYKADSPPYTNYPTVILSPLILSQQVDCTDLARRAYYKDLE